MDGEVLVYCDAKRIRHYNEEQSACGDAHKGDEVKRLGLERFPKQGKQGVIGGDIEQISTDAKDAYYS